MQDVVADGHVIEANLPIERETIGSAFKIAGFGNHIAVLDQLPARSTDQVAVGIVEIDLEVPGSGRRLGGHLGRLGFFRRFIGCFGFLRRLLGGELRLFRGFLGWFLYGEGGTPDLNINRVAGLYRELGWGCRFVVIRRAGLNNPPGSGGYVEETGAAIIGGVTVLIADLVGNDRVVISHDQETGATDRVAVVVLAKDHDIAGFGFRLFGGGDRNRDGLAPFGARLDFYILDVIHRLGAIWRLGHVEVVRSRGNIEESRPPIERVGIVDVAALRDHIAVLEQLPAGAADQVPLLVLQRDDQAAGRLLRLLGRLLRCFGLLQDPSTVAAVIVTSVIVASLGTFRLELDDVVGGVERHLLVADRIGAVRRPGFNQGVGPWVESLGERHEGLSVVRSVIAITGLVDLSAVREYVAAATGPVAVRVEANDGEGAIGIAADINHVAGAIERHLRPAEIELDLLDRTSRTIRDQCDVDRAAL